MEPTKAGVSLVWAVLLSTHVVRSQPGIELTLPRSVNAVVGKGVVLPAAYSTNRRINLIEWSVIDRTNTKERRPVFLFNPNTGVFNSGWNYGRRVHLEEQASLRMDHTRREDAGTYVLKLTTDDLQTTEAQVELVVMVPPTVRVGPSNPHVVTKGKSVTLTCSVRNGFPNITSLTWQKNGVPIERLTPDDLKYKAGSLKSPNLVIRSVDRTDAGKYTCAVSHPATDKDIKSGMSLNVLYPAAIIRISEAHTVPAKESVTLQCIAEGNPLPNMTWTRDGVVMPSKLQSVSGDLRSCTMVLHNARMNETGSYTCKAWNSIDKPDAKPVFLTVGPPAKGLDMSTVAIVIGVTVGFLWVSLCFILLVCYIRRRRHRAEKTKFAFYYNLGKREPNKADEKSEEGPKVPAKPRLSAPMNTGIGTMRKSKKGQERRYAKVLYPYLPIEENELCLQIDDVIEVLEGEDGGWCLGYLRGRIGLFPSNYVSFLKANEGKPVAPPRSGIELDDTGKRSI
ncbi:PREDICTED: nectin-4-like [Branchiostoma belcheri]|uniref:Nectin-4-like n=1 Tax=Branchiostoma belcheri TaxID=7741 RepID=A0A6P5A818_BRABE|nr:PREDICTED: nectin-4-like [Branchiostoma belcheri]